MGMVRKIRNSLSYKVIREWHYYQKHPKDVQSFKRLRGLITASQQNQPQKFQNIYNLASQIYTSQR